MSMCQTPNSLCRSMFIQIPTSTLIFLHYHIWLFNLKYLMDEFHERLSQTQPCPTWGCILREYLSFLWSPDLWIISIAYCYTGTHKGNVLFVEYTLQLCQIALSPNIWNNEVREQWSVDMMRIFNPSLSHDVYLYLTTVDVIMVWATRATSHWLHQCLRTIN